MQCFNDDPTIHKNHRLIVFQCNSALCDCGDINAMHSSGFCSNHKGNSVIKKDVLNNLPPKTIE